MKGRSRNSRISVVLAMACAGNYPKAESRDHIVGAEIDIINEPQMGEVYAEVDWVYLSLEGVPKPRTLDIARLRKTHPGLIEDLRTMALEEWDEERRNPLIREDDDE